MDKDQLKDCYSKVKETLLSFLERYEKLGKTLPVEDINRLNQAIEINKQNNEVFQRFLKVKQKEEQSQILLHQEQKNQQNKSPHDFPQSNIHDHEDSQRKTQSISKDNLSEKNSEQIIRKSKRLLDKEKRKQTPSPSQQPRRNYTSMIKKLEKQKKSQQSKQMSRPLIQRLKNPGKATLRETSIMFKNNQFYYSINVKIQQYCKQHKPETKCSQNYSSIELQLPSQQTIKCNLCKKVGTYWFSSQQLQRYNNKNFIRKYLETFI